jgi:hypothetical protein
MTTVCGLSEMKRVECRTEVTARRCEIDGISAAMEIVAGAHPVRFAAPTCSETGDSVSATSAQGPQWDDEAGGAMADAV